MTATTTPLTDFARDMERHGVPPFRDADDSRLSALAIDLRQAAIDDDPRSFANHIRTVRLERLWKIEDWLMLRKQQHPRIARWLSSQLVAIGWRRPKA